MFNTLFDVGPEHYPACDFQQWYILEYIGV